MLLLWLVMSSGQKMSFFHGNEYFALGNYDTSTMIFFFCMSIGPFKMQENRVTSEMNHGIKVHNSSCDGGFNEINGHHLAMANQLSRKKSHKPKILKYVTPPIMKR